MRITRNVLSLLVLVVIVGGMVYGFVHLSKWLYFGPVLAQRDYVAEHRALVLQSTGVSEEEGRAGWEAYQRVLRLQREAYLRAFGEIRRDEKGNESYTLTINLASLSPETDAEKVAPLMKAAEDVGLFNAMDELGARRVCLPPRDGAAWPLDEDRSDYGAVRELARLLRYRALDATQPEPARVEAIRRQITLAAAIMGDHTIMAQLIGSAVCSLALQDAIRLSAAGELTPESCRVLANGFLRFRIPSGEEMIIGEKLLALATIQATLGESRIRAISRSAQISMLDEAMSADAQWARLAPAERRQRGEPPSTRLDTRHNPVAGVLLPSVARAVHARDEFETRVRGAAVYLALIACSRTHAGPPERLEQLVPEFLPDLPADPYSGKPFAYRVESGGDATPPGFVLYSVGADGVDDGGRPATAADAPAALHEQAAGMDLVIGPGRR
jgi:hypothetical protein